MENQQKIIMCSSSLWVSRVIPIIYLMHQNEHNGFYKESNICLVIYISFILKKVHHTSKASTLCMSKAYP